MFTKHTSHSTVNPLDAKQTHQELLPPRAPGGSGAAAPTASSRFPWFLWFGFLFFLDTIPAASIRAHLLGACFARGVCFLPPRRLFPLGRELWEAPASARGGSGSVGDAGTHSLPSQVHFKAKRPHFSFSGAGRQQAGDAPVAPGGAGSSTRLCRLSPLAFPMWESPLEILEMPTSP